MLPRGSIHLVTPVHPIPAHAASSSQLDELMLLGFLAAGLALVLFLYRHQSPTVSLALGFCLLGTALYAFMSGPWPIGLVQIAFAMSSFRSWKMQRSSRTWGRTWNGIRRRPSVQMVHPGHRDESMDCDSRINRMFGSI